MLNQAIILSIFGMGFVFIFLIILVVAMKIMHLILSKSKKNTNTENTIIDDIDEDTKLIIEQAIRQHRGV